MALAAERWTPCRLVLWRRRRGLRAGIIAVGALLSACGEGSQNGRNQATGRTKAVAPDPSSLVTLDASPTHVSPGGTLSLTLSNRTRNRISYHHCSGTLEVMLEKSTGASVRDDRICAFELRTLDPGASVTYDYHMPRNIVPGTYRLATGIDGIRTDMGALVLTSNPIEVG